MKQDPTVNFSIRQVYLRLPSKAMNRSTLVFRFFKLASFVYGFRLFQA